MCPDFYDTFLKTTTGLWTSILFCSYFVVLKHIHEDIFSVQDIYVYSMKLQVWSNYMLDPAVCSDYTLQVTTGAVKC